jgi:hypothetical protein
MRRVLDGKTATAWQYSVSFPAKMIGAAARLFGDIIEVYCGMIFRSRGRERQDFFFSAGC